MIPAFSSLFWAQKKKKEPEHVRTQQKTKLNKRGRSGIPKMSNNEVSCFLCEEEATRPIYLSRLTG